jgi:hypothetical protein
MSSKQGNTFGTFGQTQNPNPFRVPTIRTEFSKGGVPGSITVIDRESSWTRWRKGYEMASASLSDNAYAYDFSYKVPFPEGFLPAGTSYPDIQGSFKGYPTKNKEFGMHWGGVKKFGSVRFDQLQDQFLLINQYWFDAQFEDYENVGQWLDEEAKVQLIDAYIESITEDANNWYVKLNGPWSTANKLPAPLYIDLGSTIEGLKALNGEVIEDRIITKDGIIIDRDSIDPNTQRRYGYVQAVLVDTDENTGILTLRKSGSVEATPDRVLVTPATRPPAIGRYFITGTRYCCTCQDFNRRDYSYMTNLGSTNKKAFPRTSVASVKPGRYELLKSLGIIDNASMTDADINRILEIVAPSQDFQVPGTITTETSINRQAARDNPGVYREFGSLYLRTSENPALEGSKAEGMPGYADYSAIGNSIQSITDIWTPVLDEMRYCKHIYAMRFHEGVLPPEPSDFPVEIESMAQWEQDLVAKHYKDQGKTTEAVVRRSLSLMDVPPYNCQTQAMQPMLQRLFNIPLTYIKIDGFTMYDKNGLPYVPANGEKPGI